MSKARINPVFWRIGKLKIWNNISICTKQEIFQDFMIKKLLVGSFQAIGYLVSNLVLKRTIKGIHIQLILIPLDIISNLETQKLQQPLSLTENIELLKPPREISCKIRDFITRGLDYNSINLTISRLINELINWTGLKVYLDLKVTNNPTIDNLIILKYLNILDKGSVSTSWALSIIIKNIKRLILKYGEWLKFDKENKETLKWWKLKYFQIRGINATLNFYRIIKNRELYTRIIGFEIFLKGRLQGSKKTTIKYYNIGKIYKPTRIHIITIEKYQVPTAWGIKGITLIKS